MNKLKLQTDILKAVIARDEKRKKFDYIYAYNGNFVYVIIGGNMFLKIYKGFFYLDAEKAFSDPQNHMNIIEKFLKASEEAEVAVDTRVSEKLSDGRTVRKFTCGEKNLWVDEARFKYFEKDGLSFKASPADHALFVYEYDMFAGMVMSTNKN